MLYIRNLETLHIPITSGTDIVIDAFRELKRALQIEENQKLFLYRTSSFHFKIICQNNKHRNQCQFEIQAFGKNTQQLYINRINAFHSIYCSGYRQDQTLFQALNHVNLMKSFLQNYLRHRRQKGYRNQKPKKLVQQIKVNYDYDIYQNVTNRQNKKRIKKKFDNLVHEVRKRINFQIGLKFDDQPEYKLQNFPFPINNKSIQNNLRVANIQQNNPLNDQLEKITHPTQDNEKLEYLQIKSSQWINQKLDLDQEQSLLFDLKSTRNQTPLTQIVQQQVKGQQLFIKQLQYLQNQFFQHPIL